ncbi:MAG: POTRA domain-containing protein [Elusimicrobiota bacterium]
MKKLLLAACLIAFYSILFAEIIKNIEITGNRVNESVIRSRLAFKEGDILDEAKIEQSKSNLYSLGLFKSLEISSKTVDSSGGISVTVDARDGWFVLPWPFFGSRGGTRYAGGMIIEQNFFKKAERIFFFGSYQDNSSLNTVSLMLPDFTIGVMVDKRSQTEYRYSDGAFNSSLLSWDDMSKFAKYGKISDSYEKESDSFRFSAGKPVNKNLSVSLAVFSGNIIYRNPASAPGDEGRINAVQVSGSYGKMESRADMLSGFGRIFGLGMADLNDKLKPLAESKTYYGFQASLENSNKGIGSDFEYNKASLSASRTTVFRDRSQLSLSAKTGFGSGVPFSQLFATSRREGLKGTYAREFRGDAIAAANASYRHSFSRNSIGQLNGEIFAEYAAVYLNGTQKEKEGAGLNLVYQFWRFPLPIGFGYTYCFDDYDWQASVGVGGFF